MRSLTTLCLLLYLTAPAFAQPRHYKKFFTHLAEHLALGAATEIGVSQLADGPSKYAAGIVAAGVVAGFKEGTDARDKRDTKKQAAWHAFSILAGAGIMAEARH